MGNMLFPKLILEPWDADFAELMPEKGYFDAEVALADGHTYTIFFVDPARLGQSLNDRIEAEKPFLAEPGMVVLPLVTIERINRILPILEKEGFFKYLKPRHTKEK
jgi:hypothetical protein